MSTMPTSGGLSSPGNGLRFLSFDGGGIQAVSQALMVREMMSCVGVDCQLSSPARVCDYFDMICGSGFGGLLAIMCGILKMTGDELVDEFVNLCKAVFSEGLDTTQRTTVLEGEIKRLIRTYSGGGEEQKMVSPDDICKVFVCAAPSQNTSHPPIFRNYQSPTDTNVDCMLWEATCATTVLLGLFSPIVIGEASVDQKTIEGDLRWNNSTEQLLKEATHIFEGRAITSVVNIGSGHSGDLSLSEEVIDLFPRIALDCERVADNMERRFGTAPDAFWRLSVSHDAAVDLWNLEALDSHIRLYLQGARTTRSIDALIQDLIHRPERISIDRVSDLARGESEVLSRKLCPLPTPYFTGRHSELQKLDEYFTSASSHCRIAVLYGISGSGKTQTGLKFVQQIQDRFTEVFFIDSSDKFTLENDLKPIASGVSDNPTVDDALNFLRRKNTSWLLFLNNADDPSLDLGPYIAWPHGNVLITTCNSDIRMHAPDCNIWVDKLELDDAKELLLRGVAVTKSSETDAIASEIVQELGCFTLAVSQARGFLSQDNCPLSEYMPIYMQNRRQLLEDGLIQITDDYEHIAHTTWAISFNKLSSAAAFFIELLCFMHCDAIPFRIFEDAWANLKPLVDDAVPAPLVAFLSSFEAVDSTWDVLRFRRLITEVLSFSLMVFNAKNRTFSLHPLVQKWVQSRCNHPQEMIRSTQTLLSLAASLSKNQKDDAAVIPLLPHLRASARTGLTVHYTLLHRSGQMYSIGGMLRECREAHEQEMLEIQKQLGSEHPDIILSMNNLAIANSALGQHKDALKLAERALALSIQIHGEEHAVTLTSMENLASVYLGLDQHRDALELEEKVLALRTQIHGEKHPDTFNCMKFLALTYSAFGRLRDGLRLHEKVLASSTQMIGEEHPDTLACMSDLASAYLELGQPMDALKLQEKVLALRVQILGEEHRDTLECMSRLSLVYSALGRFKDALRLQEKALVLTTQILGEVHADTLICKNNIAVTYSSLGQYTEALKLQEQVLALRVQILGEEHPETLTYMSNLASTYSDLGQFRDALKLQEKVLALRTQTVGEEHPDTLTSMNNIALTYLDLGQDRDALKLHEKVLALSTQILGEEHPDTIGSMHNLAGTYLAIRRDRDALKLEQKVLALRVQTLGEEHPDTLESMSILGNTYSALRQHKDALKLKEQVLALRVQIFGEEHLETLTCMSNLANTYSAIGQLMEALKLQEKVLALRAQILGEEHPKTLASMGSLAKTYLYLGRPSDALNLQERVLALRTQTLGEVHPDTPNSMNNLAATYSTLGRHRDALTLQEKALALGMQILGEEHPDTLISKNNLACIYSSLGRLQDSLQLHEENLNIRKKVLGPEHPSTVSSLKSVKDLRKKIASETDGEGGNTLDIFKRLLSFF
ncbi:hypothetical protein DL96DRAFT_481741 [Flagelloscypha sp. PMI_526]|nr:hypothetical protein DL96DRAFT_481741 [Flagelloscypha sp. PMI_526]